MLNFWVFISTGFGAGFFPKFPGTIGAILAIIGFYLVKPNDSDLFISFLVILFFLGVYSSAQAEKKLGHDSNHIIIDEIFGMLLSLLFVPIHWGTILAAFLLFRFFDIFKPFPINISQKLPGGWGVMIDDCLAGFFSMAIINTYFFWIQ